MSCGAGKYFCASFSPSRGPGIWNNIQAHHTIYTEIFNNTTITATLAVTADTPIGTTITFGAIENNGRPRSGGLLLTVSTAPTKPPDPTPPTLVSATTKTLTIEWTHPGDGGSPLVRNYLHYRVQGTTEWSNWYAGETPVTRAAIGGLQANTAYEVRVSVTNMSNLSSQWVEGATAFRTRANTPATGAPAITGTATVGQVLTASTTGISDADGLPATFSYQWVRVDADGTSNPVDIPGATAATYTLTAPDVGKKLRVRVSFTDDLETTETLTSAAFPSSGTVAAAVVACPVPDFAGRRKIWTAVLTMGDFTAQGSPLRGYGRFPDAGGDGGGLDPATFTIGLNEYAVEELAVDASRLYFFLPLRAIWRTPATAALRLHVCNAPYDFSDSHYAWDGRSNVIPEHAWDTALDWSSVSTRTVHLSLPDNRSATGAPVITGTAEVGQVLDVGVAGIEDEDGLYDVEYAYQWVRVDGTSNEEDISGATAATYTLTADDVGKKVKVEASFTDDFGSDEQRPSAPTATVTAAATAVCAVPSLSGRNVIWTGSMTVAVDPDNAGVFGFESGSFGTLDDETFTVGTNDYRTRLVSLMGNVLTFATTNYDLTAEEKDVLRLHVCAADLDFSAAGRPIGDHGYVFSTTGLSWSSGDTVTLRLSLPATTTAPGQVMGVGVAPGNEHLVVTWTAVDDATGYKVQWKSGGEDYNTGERQATVTPGSTTSHTIPGLANGAEYTVRVIATRTGADDGPPSAEVTGTPAVPAAAGVTVSKTALTVVEEDTTGDSYTVVLDTRPAANVLVTVAGHAGTDVTPTPGALTFTAMDWDTARTVTVTAGNDADTADESVSLTHGAQSADSDYEGITIAGVAVTVNDNDTARVMGVMVEPGDAQLVVTWTAVDNATGYTVQWRSGGEDYDTGDRQATVTPGSTTSHTIPGLANGTEYTVRVIATRTGANDGPPSAAMTGTPTGEPVPVPALPMAGAIALGLLLLGTGRRALRCRARG